MQKFTDFLTEQTKEQVNEASLSRVYQHFNSNRPVGLISAFRGDKTYDENVKNNYKLADAVIAEGYGFIWVDGGWVENKGTDNEKVVKEVSLFVVGSEKDKKGTNKDMKKFLLDQAEKYNQDAVVIKEENTKDVLLIDSDGNTIKELKNAKFDVTAEMFTSLRNGKHIGRSFVLEARERDTFASKLLNKHKS